MKIHIIGAGSIGKLIAGKLSLSHAGQPLLVARTSGQAKRIRIQGLKVIDGSLAGVARIPCVDWQHYLAAVNDHTLSQADIILLAVKQKQLTIELLGTVKKMLNRDGVAVAFQNGLGHIELLLDQLGAFRVAAGITTEGAKSSEPNSVIHTGKGWIRLGFPVASAPDVQAECLHALQKCLRKAGFDATVSNHITEDAWNKLVMNSIINPLTAIYGLPNGALLESPYLLRIMKLLFEEASFAAGLEGVKLDSRLWDQLLDVCRATSQNRSSMLQDIDAGRLTEIEWINGSLIRTAQRFGRRLPAHEAVFQAVSGIEQSR